MPYLEFLSQPSEKALAIRGAYQPVLVVLSVAVSVVAAYASLGFAGTLRIAQTRTRRAGLLVAGSITMGIGVWAMHFIGMMAFRMPMSVGYDLLLTLLSVLPACVASAVAIRSLGSAKTSLQNSLVSGLFMGSGIAVMHFTGMAAMRMPARIVYEPRLFALSGVVAVLLASVALHLNQEYRFELDVIQTPWRSLGVASVLGGAAAAMHYTAMASAYFIPEQSAAVSGLVLDPAPMSVVLALTTALLVSVALFVVRLDRRVLEASNAALKSRQRLNAALNHMSEGFSLWDASDRLLVWNEKFLDIHSLESDLTPGVTYEELAWRVAKSGVPPDAEGRVAEWVSERLAQHRTPSGPRVASIKDGRWFQVDERKTDDGGTVAIHTDISLLKNAEIELADALEHLKQTQAELLQSAKMASLGQLTAGLAHELNTPIGAVQSSSDILVRCAVRVEEVLSSVNLTDVGVRTAWEKTLGLIRENARVIADGSGRISELVDSLKGFTALDQAEYQLANVHVGLDQTIALLGHEVRDGVMLVKEYGEIPEICCSPGELNQVFMTLVTNAIRSIEDRGTVTVRTDAESGFVRVSIADTGKGIAEEARSRMFDLVFARTGSRVKMAIGLYQARAIVERHGGRIAVESVLGEGSEFTVHLPVAQHPAGA